MSEEILCPACALRMPYTPDLVGLSICCEHCGHRFVARPPFRRREVVQYTLASDAPARAVPADDFVMLQFRDEPEEVPEQPRKEAAPVRFRFAAPAAPKPVPPDCAAHRAIAIPAQPFVWSNGHRACFRLGATLALVAIIALVLRLIGMQQIASIIPNAFLLLFLGLACCGGALLTQCFSASHLRSWIIQGKRNFRI